MTIRTVRLCDRCHHEAGPVDMMSSSLTVEINGAILDICTHCKSKLDDFMAGRELEVPP